MSKTPSESLLSLLGSRVRRPGPINPGAAPNGYALSMPEGSIHLRQCHELARHELARHEQTMRPRVWDLSRIKAPAASAEQRGPYA